MSDPNYRYATDTLDFTTDGATAAEVTCDGRTTITVSVDGGGDTGDFALEYTLDGSTWRQWKTYSTTGDVDESLTIAARKVRLVSTAAGTGNAEVGLGTAGE